MCPAWLFGPKASEHRMTDVHIIKLPQPANGAAATKLPLRSSHWPWSSLSHVQDCLGHSSLTSLWGSAKCHHTNLMDETIYLQGWSCSPVPAQRQPKLQVVPRWLFARIRKAMIQTQTTVNGSVPPPLPGHPWAHITEYHPPRCVQLRFCHQPRQQTGQL